MLLLGGGAGAGDQVLKNAWRIRRTFPNGRGSLCTQPARRPWALPGAAEGSAPGRLRSALGSRAAGPRQAAGRGLGRRRPRSPAPPSFRFGPPPTIGRWPLAPPPCRPRPAVPAPRSSPPAPRGEPGGWGGAGAQTRRPSLGAARNALKRRERGRETAAPESESELKLPAGGEEERGEDEEERGEAQARLGSGARALLRKVPTSRESAGRAPSGRGEKSAAI